MPDYEDDDFEQEDVQPRKVVKNMKKFKNNDIYDKEYMKRGRDMARQVKAKRQLAD